MGFTALTGVTIIECTKIFSGPYASRMAADWGAHVIKVEDVDHPDESRMYPPIKNGSSGYFETVNRNKDGIVLQLSRQNAEDREEFRTLIRNANVFITNFVPHTREKLHITYEDVRQINPSIIYLSIIGDSRDAERKYFDLLAQADSGLMSLSGSPGHPMKIGPSVIDTYTGMTACAALCAALFSSKTTGQGRYISVSMLGCALQLLEQNIIEASMTHVNPKAPGNQDTAIAPFGIFRASDGWIAIAVGTEVQWKSCVRWLQDIGVTPNEKLYATNTLRVKHRRQLERTITAILQKHTQSACIQMLKSYAIPCAPIRTMLDITEDMTIQSSGVLARMEHTNLGTCIVPGYCVQDPAESTVQPIRPYHQIQKDF